MIHSHEAQIYYNPPGDDALYPLRPAMYRCYPRWHQRRQYTDGATVLTTGVYAVFSNAAWTRRLIRSGAAVIAWS